MKSFEKTYLFMNKIRTLHINTIKKVKNLNANFCWEEKPEQGESDTDTINLCAKARCS